MNFSLEKKDNKIVFTPKITNLDSSVSNEMKYQILIISQPDIEALAIDLSHIEYIDSSGLGVLLLAHRQLKEYEIPVILIGANEVVKNLLKISHLIDLFEFYESVEDFLK